MRLTNVYQINGQGYYNSVSTLTGYLKSQSVSIQYNLLLSWMAFVTLFMPIYEKPGTYNNKKKKLKRQTICSSQKEYHNTSSLQALYSVRYVKRGIIHYIYTI